MSIKVLIADDSALTRCGLAVALSGSDVEVVGEASNGEQAVERALDLKPDVVVMEIRMPIRDGLWALEQLTAKLPESRVVIYSVYDHPSYVAQAIALGAKNYLSKRCGILDLRKSVCQAVTSERPNGASLLAPIADMIFDTSVPASPPDDDLPLTKREHQILRLISLGLNNRLIATCLKISVETVKEHVQNVLRKLGLRDRTEAAVFAVRRGVI